MDSGSILGQSTYVVSSSKATHTYGLVLVKRLAWISLHMKRCIDLRKGFVKHAYIMKIFSILTFLKFNSIPEYKAHLVNNSY